MKSICARSFVLMCLVVPMAFAFSGCAGDDSGLYQFKGRLTHQGEPIPDMKIFFLPEDTRRQSRKLRHDRRRGAFRNESGQYAWRGTWQTYHLRPRSLSGARREEAAPKSLTSPCYRNMATKSRLP